MSNFPNLFDNLNANYLHHYTKLDTALNCILNSKTLRLNICENVNDPKESNVMISLHSPSDFPEPESGKTLEMFVQANRYFKKGVKILCFSQDDPRFIGTNQNHFAFGYVKPRMWATYGDNHKGVCLVFDKEKLANQIRSELSEKGTLYEGAISYDYPLETPYGKVVYSATQSEALSISLPDMLSDFELTMKRQIESYYHTYFFCKHEDWKTENEYRWILQSESIEPEIFSFGDSLLGIVVGRSFPEKEEDFASLLTVAGVLKVPIVQVDWSWMNVSIKELFQP
jgi:hypothetical protein